MELFSVKILRLLFTRLINFRLYTETNKYPLLKINTDKTKVVIFKKERHIHHNFTLCGKLLEVVI